MDNKTKGNLAVASAINHYISVGYTVSIPLTDTAKYDLVVEREGVCQRVQCKYAGYEANPGIFAVPLYVSGGNRSSGNRRIRYQVGDFDILYVLCTNGRTYALPLHEIVGQVTICVGRESKWSKWEHFALLASGIAALQSNLQVNNFPNSVKPLGDGDAEPSPR